MPVNRDAVAAYVRRDLTTYKRLMYRQYAHAPHLDALDKALMSVTRYVETGGKAGTGRLIVEMPPRHGKTLTVSRMYPTWHLGRNPDSRVMLVSYGATLAQKNSRMARNLIAAPRYRDTFGVSLDPGSRAADAWDLQGHEGGCDAMGITGAATGKGAHVLVIDDPIKSRAEAESEVYRDNVWDAYSVDLYTRLEPGGAVVVMMTRWHQDDLIGRLLRDEPEGWERLRLPAFAEADDPLGRTEGDALWPYRYPQDVLTQARRTLGEYNWSALYQQNPTPAEGGIFKRKWFEPLMTFTPEIVRAVRYWDMAMSEKTSADYTVGVKIGQATDGHYYVLDVARRQIEWGDLTDWIASVMLTDGASVAQGLEEKGYMSRAIKELNADPRLHGYEIWGYPVDKDKLTRALPVAAKSAAGLIHITESHWTRAFIDEVCAFPNGMHDDQVDAFAGAWTMIGDEGSIVGYVTPAANPRTIAGIY